MDRSRARTGVREAAKRRRQRMVLEHLEPRALLSNLPAPSVVIDRLGGVDDPIRRDVSNPSGLDEQSVLNLDNARNESSPSIAVSPNNPNKLVAVWTQTDLLEQLPFLAVGQGAYTTDGGRTWVPLALPKAVFSPLGAPDDFTDFNRLPRTMDTSVAMDRDDNIYIVSVQNDAADTDSTAATAGAIVLNKYNFSTGTPVAVELNKILYAWNEDTGVAIKPTIVVDDTVPSYQDPTTGAVQTNPFSGNIYVAWTDVNSGGQIKLVASSDGGQSFSARRGVSDFVPDDPNFGGGGGFNFGSSLHTAPRMTVSQGRADGQGAQPGQVTVVWDDFGIAPGTSTIKSDSFVGSVSQTFGAAPGVIRDATTTGPRTTNFPIRVNITDPRFDLVTDLDLRLALVHPATDELTVTLIAPDGKRLPLFVGLTGVAVGVGGGGVAFGATFDQEAVLGIAGAAEPYIGHYKPAFQFPPAPNQPDTTFNLGDYYGATPNKVNGVWTIEIIDNSIGAFDGTNPPQLVEGSLIITAKTDPGTNLNGLVGDDVVVATTNAWGALEGPYPILVDAAFSAAFDRGVNAGVSIVSDNTLGSFRSEHQGRIYVALTDFYNFAGSLTGQVNTDVFLVYSDNGGQTWTRKGATQANPKGSPINDDVSSRVDGFTTSLLDPENGTAIGRPQFGAELAIDQTTGTLAVSFYDARYDAQEVRVARTVTTSIDGGQSFSPQLNSFANAPNAPLDVIAREEVVLGPIPDNLSEGLPDALPTLRLAPEDDYGFGDRQGMVFTQGRIFTAWSGNENGGPQGVSTLDIRVTQLATAIGPRVVRGTMGQVKTKDASGVPQAEDFTIEFDRPVDIRTFTAADIEVRYLAPSAPAGAFTLVDIGSITPLDPSGPVVAGLGQIRATTFRVAFLTPQQAVGTYSYKVGPEIRDFGSGTSTTITPSTTQTFAAGTSTAFSARTGSISIPDDSVVGATATVRISGIPSDVTLADLNVRVSINHPDPAQLRLVLESPGGVSVVLSDGNGAGGANYTGTVFDDQAATSIVGAAAPFTGSFRPQGSLAVFNGITPNGDWKLRVVDQAGGLVGTIDEFVLTLGTGATYGALGLDTVDGGKAVHTLQVVSVPSGDVLTDVKVFLAITHTDARELTLTLIAPNATRIPLPTAPTANAYESGVTFSIATLGLLSPVQLRALTGNGTWQLEVLDPSGGASGGQLTDFELSFNTEQTYEAGDTPVPVSPNATTSSLIPVNLPPTILLEDVDVLVSASSFNARDLVLTLVKQDTNGNEVGRVLLSNRNGTGNVTGRAYTDTLFDQQATTAINAGAPNAVVPFTGSFQPQGDLSTLNGLAGAGSWFLEVQNKSLSRTAFINDFEITLRSSSLTGRADDDPSTGAVTGVPIPTRGLATATTVVSTAPGGGTIRDLNVNLSIQHPNPQQLDLYLIGPNGARVLLAAAQGTIANAYTNTIFDDQAGTSIAGAAGFLTGSFQPQQGLSAFNGTNANGTWALEVLDRVNGVVGTITDFSLKIATRTSISTNTPVSVPDNATRTSSLNVSTLPFGSRISDVNVTINIPHLNVGDLIIDLISPAGTVVNLATNQGGQGDNYVGTVFDEQGLTGNPPVLAPFITAGTPPYTNIFRTQDRQNTGVGLDRFNGELGNGTWRLRMTDNAGNNISGSIGAWSLEIETAVTYGDPPQTVPTDDTAISVIQVAGLPATDALADLDIQVSIDHPSPQDLTLLLIAPDGTTALLASGQGGTTANAYTNTLFDDQAASDVFGQTGSLTGSFRPEDSLIIFNGKNANGRWKLLVANTAGTAPATIREFALSFRSETNYASLPAQASIPDPGVVIVPLTVSGINPTDVLTDIDVSLSVNHPFDSDLAMTLIAPDGTRILLASGNGGNADNFTSTIFDDQASVAINAGAPTAVAPFSGRFRPLQSLSTLGGLAGAILNGEWKLEVRDRFAIDGGAVTDFQLNILTAPTFAPSTSLPVDVLDDTTQTLTIPVSGLPAGDLTADVDLTISIDHPSVADLRIFLESPDGTRVALVSNTLAPNPPTLTGVNLTDTTFDDQAGTAINAGAAPFTGRFIPQSSLSPLNGRVANGDWKLIVEDSVVNGQTGTIKNVRLMILTETAASTLPLPIRDLGTATSALLVDSLPADEVVTDVDVRVSLTHPLAAGLDLYLVAPDGTRVGLSSDNGGLTGADYAGTIFDDQATASIVGATAPFTGRFQPEQPLSRFNGLPGNGIWRLEIVDDSTATIVDEGLLTEFSLEISTGPRDVIQTIDGNAMDQDADALTIDSFAPGTPAQDAEAKNDSYATPRSLLGEPFAPAFDSLTLPLIVSGPRVIKTFVEGAPTTADNLVTDTTVGSLVVEFDRDMRPDTFKPVDVLRLEGPGGVIAGGVVAGPFGVVPITGNPRQFRVTFPAQQLSGTYTIVLGPDIESVADSEPGVPGGDKVDANQNAGLDFLRGVAAAGTTRVSSANPTDVPIPAAPSPVLPSTVESIIDLTNDPNFQFVLKDLDVRINIAFPSAPNLQVELVAEKAGTGGADVTILLVSRIGQTGTRADFFDTIFNDQAVTPIQNGGPPFQGEYNPQVGLGGQPLAALNDTLAARRYRLVVTNFSSNALDTGLLNEWELIFQKPVPVSGLGESVADRTTASFRIFTMDPTNPLSSTTWTAVGPAGVSSPDRAGAAKNAEVVGRINDLAIDPSDPTGNTVYAATASGGLWKTTNFLTADSTGPIWIPLLDNAPLNGMTIGGLTLVGVNNDPNQTRIFVATGDGRAVGDPQRPSGTTSRGVGFLRSLDGGATWQLLDSTNNTLAFAQRNHFFAAGNGTTAFRIVSDPKLTPGGKAILYAALADLDAVGELNYAGVRGGLWRSLDNGDTWVQLRAGQASDVALDPLSGTGAPDGSLQFLYAAFQNDGIYFSNNRGDDLLTLPGSTGKPLIQNVDFAQPQPAPAVTPFTPNATRFSPNSYGAGIPGFADLHFGRIQLAKPAPTGDVLKDSQYQGWMYASVQLAIGDLVEDFPPILPRSSLYALFMTKDFGQNWTRIIAPDYGLPSNFFDPNDVQNFTPSVDPTGGGTPGGGTPYFFGNFSSALAVDSIDPNVIYFGGSQVFGGSALVRINTTGIADPHAFYLSNDDPDQDPTEGMLRTHAGYADSTANPLKSPLQADESGNPLTLFGPALIYPYFGPTQLGDPNFDVSGFDPIRTPFLNLIRNPNEPFRAGATVLVHGITRFNNAGTKSRWTPFDQASQPDPFDSSTGDNGSNTWSRATRGIQRILTVRDPLTGATRLYLADDNGVYTAVDQGDGSLVGSVGFIVDPSAKGGDVDIVNGSRNGNLQIAQFRAGASQPTALSAQLAVLRGMFMGNGEEIGQPISTANILEVGQADYGNLQWVSRDNRESGLGVATQQNFNVVTDLGGNKQPSVAGSNVYQFETPAGLVAADFPGDTFHAATDFFQVNNISRTFGLVQTQNGGNVPDAQWPFREEFSFAVNPLNGNQIVIGSAAGRIFRTETAGTVWSEIARPGVDVDASIALSFAYGAPEKQDPTNLGDFIYVGKESGSIYVTRTGGAPWSNISTGLDRTPVRSIVANPTRGSYDAYAVTDGGVFYIADIRAANARWTNITGNLFDLTRNPLGQLGLIEFRLQKLTALAVDFRYAIPDDFANPAGASHPILYVAGDSGVYRSIDKGVTWSPFPARDPSSLDNTPVPPGDGGGLPSVLVTDLDLVLGAIDPTNGRPQGVTNDPVRGKATSPNVLLATTYGRGAFALRLAPVTLADSLHLSPTLPAPGGGVPPGSDSGSSNTDAVTNVTSPVITGYSQQTAFGNVVKVRLIRLVRTNPADPNSPLKVADNNSIIGGWDGTSGTDIPANRTDETGLFSVGIKDGVFASNGSNDGEIFVGVQTFDQANTPGNIAVFRYTLDTTLPFASGVPDLQAASDTGVSSTDNVTSARSPAFDIGNVEPGAVVVLFRNGVEVRRATSLLGGTVTLSDPGPVPDGAFVYTSQQIDIAGNLSPISSGLTVILPDTPPTDPNAPDLVTASDSGISDTDNVTNDNTPTFQINLGGSAAGATVQLFRRRVGTTTDVLVGSVQVPGQITDTTDASGNTGQVVPDGVYEYFTIRGATRSASLVVSVDTIIDQLNAPRLQPASDTGVLGDNITSVTSPTFDVLVVEAGATIQLYRQRLGFPLQLARTLTSPIGGTVGVQDLGPLVDADYDYTAIQTDIAGNISVESSAARLTILGGNANPPSAPDLLATSDSGRDNSDDVAQASLSRLPVFSIATANASATVQLLRKIAGAADDTYIVVNSRTGPGTISDPGPVFIEGRYEYAARQITQIGQATIFSAISPSLGVTIDNTAPGAPSVPDLRSASDTGSSNSDNVTADNRPVFQVGGLELGAIAYLLRSGAIVATSLPADATGVVTLTDPGPVADGTYIYRVAQEDLAGNISALGSTLQVVIDTIAPTAPTTAPDLLATSDSGAIDTDNITSNNSPTFSIIFPLPPQQVLFARLLRRSSGSSDPYTVVAVTTTAGPVSSTTSVQRNIQDPGPVPDGVYDYVFQVVDLAGNPLDPTIGPFSPTLTVTIDTTSPAVPAALDLQAVSDSGISDTDDLTNLDSNLQFTASGVTPGAFAELYRDGALVDRRLVPAIPGSTITLVDIGPVPEGPHSYTVRQVDLAGNFSDYTPVPPLSVTIDRTSPAAPSAPVLDPASDTGFSDIDNLTNAQILEIQVGGIPAGMRAQLFRSGFLNPLATLDADGSVDVSGLADGVHRFFVRLIDAAGNASANSAELVVTVDRAAPGQPAAPDLQAASDTGSSSTDNLTSDITPTFDATGVETNAFVELLRDGVSIASRTGPGPITDPGAPEGSRSYTIRQTDAAGNVGPLDSLPLVVVVDPTLPSAPDAPDLDVSSDSGPDKTDNLTNATSRSFNLTGVPAGLTVQLLRDGTVVASRVGAGSVVDDVALSDGPYTYTARVLSALGNAGSPSAPLVVTIDRTPPSSPTLPDLQADSDTGTSAIDNLTARRNPTFDIAGVTPASLTVELLRDGTVVASRVGSGPLTDPGPVADGTYRYSARTIDTAGNASTPGGELVVTIDGTAPTPALNLLPADDLGVKGDNRTSIRRPRLTGTTDPGTTVTLIDGSGRTLASTIAAADGKYELRPDANLPIGTNVLRARARDLAGNLGVGTDLSLQVTTLTAADYDGDGKSDYAVYGYNTAITAAGRFLIERSLLASINQPFGGPRDYPIVGDYDGDGISDIGAYGYSPDEGFARFAVLLSSGGILSRPFGGPYDVPMTGDYDGDGKTDLAVYGYSPDNGFSRFAVLLSGGSSSQYPAGNVTQVFGGPDDLPMAGDYDGDGKTDLGVYGYSPDNGFSRFAVLLSGGPSGQYPAGNITRGFGGLSDSPIVGDYDGDGKTDLAVYGYSPDNGFSRFAVLLSGGPSGQYPAGNITRGFGGLNDLPIGADYDGDGKTDLAVHGFSSSENAARFAVLPSSGTPVFSKPFGVRGDIGLPPSSRIFAGVGTGQIPAQGAVIRTAVAPATTNPSGNTDSIPLLNAATARSASSTSVTGSARLDLGSQAARFSTRRRPTQSTNQVKGSTGGTPKVSMNSSSDLATNQDQNDHALASALNRLGRIRASRLINHPRQD